MDTKPNFLYHFIEKNSKMLSVEEVKDLYLLRYAQIPCLVKRCADWRADWDQHDDWGDYIDIP